MVLWTYNALNLPSLRFSSNQKDWPANAYVRTHMGEEVLWHAYEEGSVSGGRHLTVDLLEQYRLKGDDKFDEIFELFAKEGRPLRPGDDLFERGSSASKYESQSEADRALDEALKYYSKLPSWVDKAQLKRGQDVFLAYLPAIGASLYYRSLVPGFSIPKIAAVLQATAYLAPPASKKAVHERLMDTGAFLGSVFSSDSVNTILPNGDGWRAAIRVRVLHTKVRQRLLSRKGNRQWDVKRLGVPINQEDLAATLLAFSTNSLWGVEFVLGRPIPLQDRLDYLALWRYLGWLLGIDVDEEHAIHNNSTKLRALDPCGPGWYPSKSNPLEHSHAVFQSIIKHLMHPDESSIRISHHLLRQGRRQDGDSKDKEEAARIRKSDANWFYFRSYQCRRFVGDPLADALELPYRPTWLGRLFQHCLSTFYLTLITFYTMAGLPFSPLRWRLIRYHRKHMAVFLDRWTEEHMQRMRKNLKVERGDGSVCPFAMVTNEKEEE